MKLVVSLVLVMVLIPLQGFIGDFFSIGNVKPDLGFLAIYFSGLLFGSGRGALMGISIGFVCDVLSGGTTLVQMESGLIIGFLSGMIRQALLNLRWFFNLLILFVFSLFYSYLIFLFLGMTSKETMVHYPWKDLIITKGIFDAFLGSLVFWVLMKSTRNKGIFEEKDELERLFFSTSGKS